MKASGRQGRGVSRTCASCTVVAMTVSGRRNPCSTSKATSKSVYPAPLPILTPSAFTATLPQITKSIGGIVSAAAVVETSAARYRSVDVSGLIGAQVKLDQHRRSVSARASPARPAWRDDSTTWMCVRYWPARRDGKLRRLRAEDPRAAEIARRYMAAAVRAYADAAASARRANSGACSGRNPTPIR